MATQVQDQVDLFTAVQFRIKKSRDLFAPLEYMILKHLSVKVFDNPGSMQRLFGVKHAGGMTRPLSSMTMIGLLVPELNQNDKRQIQYKITNKGREALGDHRKRVLRFIQEVRED